MKFFLCFLGLLIGLSGRGQTAGGRVLQISIRALCDGSTLPEGAFVPGPVDLFVHPDITTTFPVHPGDSVKIDFFCDGRKLCSGKAVWRDAAVPPTLPGQAAPRYRIPAQFVYPNCLWTNVPPGRHVLSARAFGFHNFSAETAPLQITVLSPPVHRPPSGTRRLTGKQHPPLQPNQVRIFKPSKAARYEVVGLVTARADGAQPADFGEAILELKTQAGFLGANGIILEKLMRSPGTPFSTKNVAFAPPEIQMVGRAIYLQADEK